jgi:hypothetical protein
MLNLKSYLVLLSICLLGILYGRWIQEDYAFIRLWDFENLAWMLLGIPFLFIQKYAGIPDFWDINISNKSRLYHPVLIGAVFGILDVVVIKWMMHPEPYTELPPFLQPFPYSLFIYLSGAFEIEVFYRLIPITIMAILGKKLFSGRYFNLFLWIGIIASSLREPLEQWPAGHPVFIFYAVFSGFLMNLIQGICFFRYGFVAAYTLRLGHYIIWHILLGIYVQYFELS